MSLQVMPGCFSVDEDPIAESFESPLEAILQLSTSDTNLISVNQLLESVRWSFPLLYFLELLLQKLTSFFGRYFLGRQDTGGGRGLGYNRLL